MSLLFFFFKQMTAYEMRISDWSSDVCSSDLRRDILRLGQILPIFLRHLGTHRIDLDPRGIEDRAIIGAPLILDDVAVRHFALRPRSEEHTSELQSLMRISYAVFCLKKKITTILTTQLVD